MTMWSLTRFAALCALVIVPMGVLAKTNPTSSGDPSETPAAASPPSFTYLGSTYAPAAGCFATGFIVGITQTTLGQTDDVIVAMPITGGVLWWPPQPKAASGAIASASLGDAVCLQPTGSP